MAGARQRLRDRHRAGRTPSACARLCDRHTGVGADGVLAARAAPTRRGSSPGCGSSTRTALRPSCRATAFARRCCTCAAAGGPTPSSSRSRRSPARSGRRSSTRARAGSTWAVRAWGTRSRSPGIKARKCGSATRSSRCASLRPTSSSALDLGDRRARRSRTTRASRIARTSRSGPSSAGTRSGRGSSSAGWGRRSAPARARAELRRGARPARRRQPGHGAARRRRAGGRRRRGPARRPHRLGDAGVRGRGAGRMTGVRSAPDTGWPPSTRRRAACSTSSTRSRCWAPTPQGRRSKDPRTTSVASRLRAGHDGGRRGPRRAARGRARRLSAPAPAVAPAGRATRPEPRRHLRRAAQRRVDEPRADGHRAASPSAAAPGRTDRRSEASTSSRG